MKKARPILVINLMLLMSSFSDLSLGQTARDYYIKASGSFQQADYHGAITNVLVAKRILGATNPKLEGLLAQAYFLEGEIVKAKAAYKKLLEVTPATVINSSSFKEFNTLGSQIDKAFQKEQLEYENEKQKIKEEGEELARQKIAEYEAMEAKKKDKMKAATKDIMYDLVKNSKNKAAFETYLSYFGDQDNGRKIKEERDKITNPDRFMVEAIQNNDQEELEYLIQNGGNVDYYSGGKYLVQHAVEHASTNILELLETNGATLQVTDSKGNNLLGVAAMLNKTWMCKYLVKKTNVNQQNSDGVTPLIYASANNNIEMVKILVENGASINIKSHSKEDALVYAYANNNNLIFRYLVENSTGKGYFKNGYSMLYNAINDDKPGYVTILINNGADVNQEEQSGWTALQLAAYLGREHMVSSLLNANANPNTQGKYGWTALHYAIKEGHKPIARTLVSKGASKNIKDDWNRSPRRIAKEYKRKGYL